MVRKRAFTLIELLVVIVIIGILITLVSHGLRAAKRNAKIAQARIEMSSIETALKSYWNKYGRLPSATYDSDQVFSMEDGTVEADESSAVISILMLTDDADESLNPSQVVFLEPQSGVPDGTFRDPWGYSYRIALDTDYDGTIDIDGETVRRKVALAAVGLYILNGSSDTNDQVTTWR